ncbi:hypothetical protein M413DRAFT_7136 [Hebeloma cylindrosporum]|uniref:Uncharacterized protein n=1 Tax=Hebeloma cylindrosporum TaxID=76867 RepID=A0A0C3CW20_HEBCY|nr:hypothetical protein M413DRAFT_7136 [Hebeloma cylindrosporum h7]
MPQGGRENDDKNACSGDLQGGKCLEYQTNIDQATSTLGGLIETIWAKNPNDKEKTKEDEELTNQQQNVCRRTVGWKIKVVVSVDGRKTHSAEAGGRTDKWSGETTSWRGMSSTTTMGEEEEEDNGKREISMDDGPWGPVTSRLVDITRNHSTTGAAAENPFALSGRSLAATVRPPHVSRRANKIAIWTYQLWLVRGANERKETVSTSSTHTNWNKGGGWLACTIEIIREW